MKLSSRLSLLALVPVVALSACTEETYSLEKAVRVQTTSHLKYGDFDPVKIKGKQPSDFAVHGIDISRYNPAVNWRTIKREGIDFAFVKATEGKDDVDPSFSKWWQQSGASGIPRSAYHFYYFCATPEAQAANYIRTVPKSQRSLPPILDVEWNPSSPSCKGRPAPAKVRAVLAKWLKIIEAHYGQKPIIYTTVDFHAENLSKGELPGYQYWLRSVKAEPKYIYGSRPWTFWQYTGTGKIRGIEGPVDINAWKGSRSQWNTWLKRNTR